MPKFESMVVIGFGGCAERVACTYPEISEETAIYILIANRTQQGSHIGEDTVSVCAAGIIIMGIYDLGTQIEASQRNFITVRKEKLMPISESESNRIIVIFVISCHDEAAADLAALSQLRECSFIGYLCAATQP